MKDNNQNKIDKIHKYIEELLESKKKKFIPGETVITTGIAEYDHLEINSIIDTLLNGWFALSEKGFEFEKLLSDYLSLKYSILVNSGSSANLLALEGVKKLFSLNGGEIITPALTFPTTLNPIIQQGFTPVLVDIDKTLNISQDNIEKAITENTVGIMLPHTMGNPAKIDEINKLVEEKNLFLIEDCCAALGSKYNNRICGSTGIVSTFSFYPAHGITMGEGGAIGTNSNDIKKIVRSKRDWGKDCRCNTEADQISGKCKNRFEYKIDNTFYDHRYIYSEIGYNLKPLELQAAMGIEQMNKIDRFNSIRKKNYLKYRTELEQFKDFIELPEVYEKSDPVYLGLPIIINNSKINRQDLVQYLNENTISTRMMFAGNIIKQPAYVNTDFKIINNLDYTDKIMKDAFWIGLHQGITDEMIDFVISVFKKYFKTI